ncbi:hypothetical protein Cflav_PD1992 [Pedosphaera parvula Ellin514]|uniref:Uncharacterized protein n=2 Tax=Pedosphaera TaxID=1032526 RepID=B9XN23_PEDPL|nr:hypothetical protein Cflav_PD1992 [Pedosphaera parvula Ellin514]
MLVGVLLVVGGVIWFGTHREEKMEVRGNLSAEDLAGIKNAVRSELRREILPDFSLASVKELPATTLRRLQSKILLVEVQNSTNTVIVRIKSSHDPMESFSVINGTNGWHVQRIYWRL